MTVRGCCMGKWGGNGVLREGERGWGGKGVGAW